MGQQTNLSLFVHAILPKGSQHKTTSLAGKPEEYLVEGQPFHFCNKCDGWIEGWVVSKKVDTLKPETRSGRRGIEYYCQRCASSIGFVGLRS
jgi:hypothetical protein